MDIWPTRGCINAIGTCHQLLWNVGTRYAQKITSWNMRSLARNKWHTKINGKSTVPPVPHPHRLPGLLLNTTPSAADKDLERPDGNRGSYTACLVQAAVLIYATRLVVTVLGYFDEDVHFSDDQLPRNLFSVFRTVGNVVPPSMKSLYRAVFCFITVDGGYSSLADDDSAKSAARYLKMAVKMWA